MAVSRPMAHAMVPHHPNLLLRSKEDLACAILAHLRTFSEPIVSHRALRREFLDDGIPPTTADSRFSGAMRDLSNSGTARRLNFGFTKVFRLKPFRELLPGILPVTHWYHASRTAEVYRYIGDAVVVPLEWLSETISVTDIRRSQHYRLLKFAIIGPMHHDYYKKTMTDPNMTKDEADAIIIAAVNRLRESRGIKRLRRTMLATADKA